MKFAIEDYGVDHSQYFQGVSAAFTQWDEKFLGVGATLREAIDDALEMTAQSLEGDASFDFDDWTTSGDMHTFEPEQLDADVHDECRNQWCAENCGDDTCDFKNEDCERRFEKAHDMCEMQHFAAVCVGEGTDDD